jgi:hypothetical protein
MLARYFTETVYEPRNTQPRVSRAIVGRKRDRSSQWRVRRQPECVYFGGSVACSSDGYPSSVTWTGWTVGFVRNSCV